MKLHFIALLAIGVSFASKGEPIIGPEFSGLFRLESPRVPAGIPILPYQLFLQGEQVKADTTFRVKPGTYCLKLVAGSSRHEICDINIFASSLTKRLLAAVLLKRQQDFVPDVGPRRFTDSDYASVPPSQLKPGEIAAALVLPGVELQTAHRLTLGKQKMAIGWTPFTLEPGQLYETLIGIPTEWTHRLLVKTPKRNLPDFNVTGHCVPQKRHQIVIGRPSEPRAPFVPDHRWPSSTDVIEKISHMDTHHLGIHPADEMKGVLAASHETVDDFYSFVTDKTETRINASELNYFLAVEASFYVATGTSQRIRIGPNGIAASPRSTTLYGKRIDVGDVTYAAPDGIRKVKGEYRVWKRYWQGSSGDFSEGAWVWKQAAVYSTENSDCSGKVITHDFFPTGTGIDVVPGLYKVEIRYPIDDPQNTVFQEVDLRPNSVDNVTLGD